MTRRSLISISLGTIAASVMAIMMALGGCTSKPDKPAEKKPIEPAITKVDPPIVPAEPTIPAEKLPPVMLGIDVLEADGFTAIAGKKPPKRRFHCTDGCDP